VSIILKVAEKQADQMVAKLLLDGMADAIVLSDSDFAAYTREKCLCIKEYHYSYKDKATINEIVLSTSDGGMSSGIAQFLFEKYKVEDASSNQNLLYFAANPIPCFMHLFVLL